MVEAISIPAPLFFQVLTALRLAPIYALKGEHQDELPIDFNPNKWNYEVEYAEEAGALYLQLLKAGMKDMGTYKALAKLEASHPTPDEDDDLTNMPLWTMIDSYLLMHGWTIDRHPTDGHEKVNYGHVYISPSGKRMGCIDAVDKQCDIELGI